MIKKPETILDFIKTIDFDSIYYYFTVENEPNESSSKRLNDIFASLQKLESEDNLEHKIGFKQEDVSGSIVVYHKNEVFLINDYTLNEQVQMCFYEENYSKEMKELIVVEILKSSIEMEYENDSKDKLDAIYSHDKKESSFLVRRIFARLLDDLIISVFAFPLVIFHRVTGSFGSLLLVNVLVAGLLALIYESIFLNLKGQTIGKKLLNIKVKSRDERNLTFGRSLYRTLLIRLPYNILGYLTIWMRLLVFGYCIWTDKLGLMFYWEKYTKTSCKCTDLSNRNIVTYCLTVIGLCFLFVMIGAYLPSLLRYSI